MNERRNRVVDLENLQANISEKLRKNYVGKYLTVLIEEKKNGRYVGYSKNYLRVEILTKDNKELKINDEVKVKIISAEKELLKGEL